MRTVPMCFALILLCLVVHLHGLEQALSINPIFNNHMVLQRDVEIRVWGRASAGTAVSLRLADQAVTAQADEQGKWLARFNKLSAGGPYELQVDAGGEKIALKDILIGDVWLCSGQSNMGWRVQQSKDPEKEAANAQWSQIRLFSVKLTTKQALQENVVGTWSVCSPETIPHFSAVAYYFGRHLHTEKKIPIGLINSSWGGTPAEAWTKRETLQSNPALSPITDRFDVVMENYDELAKAYIEQKKAWDEMREKVKTEKERHDDPGNKGYDLGFAKMDCDLSDWKTAKIPSMWTMNIDGAVWYRREFTVPDSLSGKDLHVYLGAIDDFDVTYVNNQEIGKTGADTPEFWIHKRKYTLKNAQAGKNIIAIRVFDHYGAGGFNSKANDMYITDGNERIELAGQWHYKVELELNPLALKNPPKPRPPMGPDHSHAPAGLYNAMIYPLMPLAIKGAIWYQGETNGGRGYQYRTLLPAMIKDWRDGFESGQFPFLIVQLANWRQPSEKPAAGGWPELREAQLLTALNDKQNGLAVTIDIGEADDIHPKNKQDVGKRLGLAAQRIAYGDDIVDSGPTYTKSEIEGNKIRLHFSDLGGGLVAKGGPLQRFSIAGEDQLFHWATATIDGDTVLVSSDAVAAPKAVRYAWEINPADCNLYNKADLPASPFRTDDWPLVSKDLK